MKTLKCFMLFLFIGAASTTPAQTAEEIIDNYIETIGGQEAWSKMESMRINGVGRQQGVDYPFIGTFTRDGRTHINVDLQGTAFIFEAFDGETKWAMNFQTQQPEAADKESSINYKNNEAKNQMPDAFFDYKGKGYKVELVGKDTFDGTEVYKIKLTLKPELVDGQEVENIEMYYFDTESFVPLAMEKTATSGPAAGATIQEVMSDYQEVDGVYMPFTIKQKFNGQTVMEMYYKTIEFNPEIDESIFIMPEE